MDGSPSSVGAVAARTPSDTDEAPVGWTPSRLRLVGLLGSLLIAAGAVGAGVLPRPDPLRHAPVLRLLRSGAGLAVSDGIVAIGMAVLVLAWLLLGRVLDRTDVRALLRTAVWWAVPLALAPPILSRDVYAYAAAGDLVQHGMNPYQHGAADLPSMFLSSTSPSWYHVPFAYGPLFLLLAGAFATVAAGHLVVIVLGMRAVAVLGVGLLGWALPRLARGCGVDPRAAVWLGLLNPLVLAHFVGGAHADALMVGLLVAGLALAASRRPLLGTVAVTLAVAVKPTAGLALPFVALLWAGLLTGPPLRRLAVAIARSVATAVVTFVAMTAVSGLGFGWVTTVSTIGLTRQWPSVATGLGLAAGRVGDWLGLGDHTTGALAVTRAAGLLIALILAVVLWVRAARAGGLRGTVLGAGWSLLAFVLLGPAVHPWYVTWGLAVLAGAGVAGRARLAVVAGSAALCFLVMPDGYNLARATGWVGVPLDVAVVVAASCYGVAWLRRGGWQRLAGWRRDGAGRAAA